MAATDNEPPTQSGLEIQYSMAPMAAKKRPPANLHHSYIPPFLGEGAADFCGEQPIGQQKRYSSNNHPGEGLLPVCGKGTKRIEAEKRRDGVEDHVEVVELFAELLFLLQSC